MTFNDKKTLILSFLMILFLITVSFFQIKKIQRIDFSSPLFEVSDRIPELTLPKMEDLLKDQAVQPETPTYPEDDYKETDIIIDNGKKIKFEYPASWEKIDPSFVEKFMEVEYTNMNVLFLAHSKDALYPLSFIVLEINEKNKENVLDQIEKIYQKKGVEMEIKKEATTEEEFLFEVSYKDGSEEIVFSREKMLFFEDKTYLFSIFAFQATWEKFPFQADRLFDSIQILE